MSLKQKIDKNSFLQVPIILSTNLLLFIIRFILKRRKSLRGNVAIIALHKIGDTVFTIPAIHKFMENNNSNITVICFEHSEKIYRQVVSGIEYLILDKSDFHFNGRIASSNAKIKLKSLFPDIIIDLTGSIVSASLIFNSRCQKIYGINEIYFKGIYDRFHPIRTTPHQVDIYFDAIKTIIPAVKNNFAGYPVEYRNNKIILIQPFAGWESKEWGFIKFLKLYHRLSSEHKCAFIFPKESINPDIAMQLEEENVKVIQSDIVELLVDAIVECSLFISNDSGPLQIAALLGKPTFSIYGPTNPKFHLPFGKFHQSIKKTLKCSPINEKYCFADGGDSCPHNDCLELLTVDEVYSGVTKFISELKDNFSLDNIKKQYNEN